ncbi:MAG TPA: TlpA disulfide reductase family protein [Phycisphaerales bacterium]|nr:TlpA disulfide reductase family protein [Phycisphaerales bacterium]
MRATLSPVCLLGALLALAACETPPQPGTAALDAAIPASVAAEWQGKVIVADFWATWCPPCRASSPNVQALHEQFAGDSGVLVVGVHADDAVDDPAAYMAEHQYTYPLVAKGQEVADAFGVNALPTFVVLDPQGREVFRHVGLLNDSARDTIADRVRALRG